LMLRATRKVNDRTGLIRLDNFSYQAGPELAGQNVEVRWHAGKQEQIEIWHDGAPIGIAPVTVAEANIDFTRKPEREVKKIRGLTYESSKKYREVLVSQHEGEAELQATTADDYLSEQEFIQAIQTQIQRALADEELTFITQFFMQCSPLRTQR